MPRRAPPAPSPGSDTQAPGPVRRHDATTEHESQRLIQIERQALQSEPPADDPSDPAFPTHEEVTRTDILRQPTLLAALLPPQSRPSVYKTAIICATILAATSILADRVPGWWTWIVDHVF